MSKFKILLIALLLLNWNNLKAQESNVEKFVNKQKAVLYLKDIPNSQFTNYARIQILDKIMAQTTEIDIKISEIYQFENLSILIHKCWQSNPEEKPENKTLITIKEYQRYENNHENIIFNGWMLSSSPSISSMEHVIYDITLIKCLNNDN